MHSSSIVHHVLCIMPSCPCKAAGWWSPWRSIYTDPSYLRTPPWQEAAHLSVVNGFLIESPQVLYLLAELTWNDASMAPIFIIPHPCFVTSQCEGWKYCTHISVSILISLLHIERPVVSWLWFDLFNFLICEEDTHVRLLCCLFLLASYIIQDHIAHFCSPGFISIWGILWTLDWHEWLWVICVF